MNKFRILFFFFIFIAQAQSQGIHLTSNGTYAQVRSYAGAQVPNAVSLIIHINYEHYLERGWSLDYRLAAPMQNNTTGLTFPPEKVFLKVQDISASNALLSSPNQLGYNLGNVPFNYNFIDLIDGSPYQKDNVPYVQIITNFFLVVEGGSYLQEFKSYNEYPIQLEFRISDKDGNVIGTTNSATLNMQVYPTDVPPAEINYGIIVKGQARSATLDFTTIESYRDGVEVEFPGAVEVTTNTDYFIIAKAATDKLYTVDNHSIALSNINIQLKSQDVNRQGSIMLSDSDQVIIQAPYNNKTTQLYDLKYSTFSNSQELIEAPSGNYSTTIIYTLTPQ